MAIDPIKVEDNFLIVEFVSPYIFNKYGNQATRFIDPWCPYVMQKLRDRYNKPITINDWYWHGHFQYSGFRERECPEGAKNGGHRQGRAIDFRIAKMDPQEIRADLRDTYLELGITLIEDEIDTWSHIENSWFKEAGSKLAVYYKKEGILRYE